MGQIVIQDWAASHSEPMSEESIRSHFQPLVGGPGARSRPQYEELNRSRFVPSSIANLST
jgi:hypothetical protein